MASSSQTQNDGNNRDDFIPAVENNNTILSPVAHNDMQIPENDPRDGQEGSPFTEDEDDVPVLTERRSGKQPQFTQEILVDKTQLVAQLSK
ncbi:hypothetical protein A2U01_0051920, partial [Trifolium medium]|nr:hypothetical protein [Trifolium medium]